MIRARGVHFNLNFAIERVVSAENSHTSSCFSISINSHPSLTKALFIYFTYNFSPIRLLSLSFSNEKHRLKKDHRFYWVIK